MRVRTVVFWCAVLVVLLPGMLLTFTRLIEPAGGRWIRIVSFTPFGMFLYLTALVLLVASGLRSRRAVTVALAGVAALGLAVHVWWFLPMVTGDNPPPPAGAATLRVMTANVFHGQGDGIALVEAAARENVDLLVVEEIANWQLAAMERAGIDELLPHRVGSPGDAGAGTMVFSRRPLGDPTQLDTTWGGWEMTMDGLTLLAVHPMAPTDSGGVARRPREDPGRGGGLRRRPGHRRPERHRRP